VGGVREGDEPRRAAELAFTHVDESGRARMVDVTGKPVTERRATARCVLRSSPDALEAAAKDEDFVPFAKATGIQGAKRTPSLIPLCHPLPLDDVDVRVDLDTASGTARLQVSTSVVARTGIEVEALTACAFAGLTLLMSLRHYDPDAVLTTLALWHKSGGRSGTWERAPGPASRDDRGGTATDPGGEPGPRSS
jgi:cyclic pyranopterin phosphate synthase